MGVSLTAIDNGLFSQNQTHQGVQADFWGLKNLICFLINKGRSVTRFAVPSKVKSGATNAPGLSCRAGTPTTSTNPPGTAGGQRPEITTEEQGRA
jgi:hypothetical protein